MTDDINSWGCVNNYPQVNYHSKVNNKLKRKIVMRIALILFLLTLSRETLSPYCKNKLQHAHQLKTGIGLTYLWNIINQGQNSDNEITFLIGEIIATESIN